MGVIEKDMNMFHYMEVYDRKTNMFFQENDVIGTYCCKKNKRIVKHNWVPSPLMRINGILMLQELILWDLL